MLLNLICEWRDCDFVCTNKRLNFLEHVTFHVKDVGIMEKSDKTGIHIFHVLCYLFF